MPAADESPAVRVGVVSDTHLPRFGRALPAALVRGLSEPPVDLILHLGDLTDLLVVDLLEEIAPVRAVAGNNDGPQIRARYRERDVVDVGGRRLGLVHGHAGRGRTTRDRALLAFDDARLDGILYGHSHVPECSRLPDGTWLVNPGSPTDRRRQPRFSYAIVEVDDAGLRPALCFYDDRLPPASPAAGHSRA